MHCPNCNSTSINGPRYGAIPGGRRRTAVMRCLSCNRTFDAYTWPAQPADLTRNLRIAA